MISVFCNQDSTTVMLTKKEAKHFAVIYSQYKDLKEKNGTAVLNLEGGDIDSVTLHQILVLSLDPSGLQKATPAQLQRIGLVCNYLDCKEVLHAVYNEMKQRVMQVSSFGDIRSVLNILLDKPVSSEKIEEIKERVGI